jgi:hypothetical protein
MKKTAKATTKARATLTSEAITSGGSTPFTPLDEVLGFFSFYANIRSTGGEAFASEPIPFTVPPGSPVWLAVVSFTNVGYVVSPGLGVVLAFHANAVVSKAQDGTGLLTISGEMQFDRMAPDSSLIAQIDVSGHVVLYSAPTPPKSALKQANAAGIKILANRNRR